MTAASYFNKTMLLALLGSIVVVGFFWAAFRKPKVVPGKLQMVAEAGYDFVRRGIVYETIGKKEGEKYVPLHRLAVLLRLDDEPLVDHPGRPVPGHVDHRVPAGAGR